MVMPSEVKKATASRTGQVWPFRPSGLNEGQPAVIVDGDVEVVGADQVALLLSGGPPWPWLYRGGDLSHRDRDAVRGQTGSGLRA